MANLIAALDHGRMDSSAPSKRIDRTGPFLPVMDNSKQVEKVLTEPTEGI